jgi:ParB family chromosome partitioning protein
VERGPAATTTVTRERPPQPAGLGEVAEALSERLETRVTVTRGRKKGKVVIEFGSMEDLKRIFESIAGKSR